jgi:hypothetical protein
VPARCRQTLQLDFRDMQAELARAQAKHKQGTRADQHRDMVTKLRGDGGTAGGGNTSCAGWRAYPVTLER